MTDNQSTPSPNDTENFHKETLRTSRMAAALKQAAEVFISDGHTSTGKHCHRCDVQHNMMEALKDTIYYDDFRSQETHR